MYLTAHGTHLLPQKASAARRIKMGVQKHFTGSLVIGCDEGRVIEFESHTERQVALVMLARRNVIDLEGQVPFAWIDMTGEARTHFFDFKITMRDGSQTCLIVKHSRKLKDPDFLLEMRCLASQVPDSFADRVSIITEKHLDPIEVRNAELIQSVRLPDPEPDAAVHAIVAGLNGAAKIEDIATASGWSGRGFLSVVRMIRKYELQLVTHQRIEPAALVRRRAC